LVIAVTCIFLVAGMVKGIVGLGLPTLAMGLLCLVMPPVEAAAILVVPGVVTNVWQMIAGPALTVLTRRFATMIVGVLAGTFATIGLLTHVSSVASSVLGAVLAVYGLSGLLLEPFIIPSRAERWLSPAVGLMTGLLNGATGVYVIPGAAYLASLRMSKDELIQAIGINAFVCPIALGIGLSLSGAYEIAAAGMSFFAVLPGLAGMYVGQRIRHRLNPAAFRFCFFIGLVALGCYMLYRSLSI
jgi:uncharacterized protein